MKALKQIFGSNLQQYTMVAALVVLTIIFNVLSGGKMLTSSNMQALVAGNAYVLILAIGMLMVIVIGQIDLSVGSVAGFIGYFVSWLTAAHGMNWMLSVLLGILLGSLIGAWHGFWLAKVGIPGFITTLAGMMIFSGLLIWLSNSVTTSAPNELSWLGAGYLPEWGPAFTGMNNSTLLLGLLAMLAVVFSQLNRYRHERARGLEQSIAIPLMRTALLLLVIGYLTWLFGAGRPGTSFPVPGLVLIVLVAIYHVITERTTFGRHVYAVGGNRAAAALSGVDTARTYFLVMLNMSFLASIAAILFIGRAGAASAMDGTGWELDAIAAVFIGGAAVSGGIGTVLGSMVGGLVMAVLNTGLILTGASAGQTKVIKGLVLLAAVAFDVYNKQQGRPSITGRLMAGRKAPAGTTPADTDPRGPESPAVAAGPVVTAADTTPTGDTTL